ncbi:MAG: S41 family peptidase [Actinoplanes sp.]
MDAASVIDQALDLFVARYIFPEKAAEAADLIRKRRAAGAYDGLDEAALAERLTAELAEVCADKHLRVRIREEELRSALTEDQLLAAYRESLRQNNYGIARVERLDGNIGYLDLRQIADAAVGGRAIAAAMELVAHTEALIIDLRQNRGGAPNGVAFWHSYFFPDGETLLNTIYEGESGETRQFWTQAWVPGDRYLNRPISVLISETTFSAGEEFCYNLKVLGRATLIGESTRGGAHPTQVHPLTPTLEITIPGARSINPVTGTNWEGTGVEPDVAVPAGEAMAVAYRRALQQVLTTAPAASLEAEVKEALASLD